MDFNNVNTSKEYLERAGTIARFFGSNSLVETFVSNLNRNFSVYLIWSNFCTFFVELFLNI